ncbi:MAG: hypothetical protein KAG97_13305, partial [Victivallales bacterium]|nr:hypothetical protein [Victivallales bacterium]
MGGADATTAIVFLSFQLLNCVLSIATLNHPLDDAFLLKIVVLTLFPLLFLLLAFQWPVDVLAEFTKVRWDDDGVNVGMRRMEWNDLESISHGLPFFKRYPLLRLVPKNGDASVFSLSFIPARLTLLGHPFVYDEMLPHIRERCPDVRMPTELPTGAEAGRIRKSIGAALSLFVALFQMILLTIMIGFTLRANFPQVQLFAFLIFLPSIMVPFVCRYFREESPGLSFLRAAIAGTGTALSATVYSFYFFLPPAWTFSVLQVTCVATLAFGVASATLKAPRTKTTGIVLRTIPAVIAMLCFCVYRLPAPALLNLSDAFGNDAPLYVWSSDGRWLADSSATNGKTKRFMLNSETGTMIPLPFHPNGDVIMWMSSSHVVRLAKNADCTSTLFIFDVRLRKEFAIDTARKILVSSLRPVSSDGEHLVWLDLDAHSAKPAVRVLDMSKPGSGNPRTIDASLPKQYAWTHVDWSGSSELTARGALRKGGGNGMGNLVLARFAFDDPVPKITTFKHKAEYWYPIPDFKYAFATTRAVAPNGERTIRIDFINLRTGRAVRLPGTRVPSWICKNENAYRTVTIDGEKSFARFDLRSCREEKITDIPPELLLLGVSCDGRYAVFAYKGMISLAKYRIYDIQTR